MCLTTGLIIVGALVLFGVHMGAAKLLVAAAREGHKSHLLLALGAAIRRHL